MENNYVWYASYGSNMLYERFLNYIKGGICVFNGKEHSGCKDKSLPKDMKPITISYKMYYGNDNSSWGVGGVSFLDTENVGESLGRMYLITKEQFADVSKQEGRGVNWYNKEVDLGEYNGIEIVTITNKDIRRTHKPSDKYLEVIRKGIKETYPEMLEFDILKYIVDCGQF